MSSPHTTTKICEFVKRIRLTAKPLGFSGNLHLAWGSRVIAILFFVFLTSPIQAANSLDVVINEIAWMGTKANSSDEWIELYNNTDQAISLEGWGLYEAGGETLIEPLTGVIEAKSYYLIERTDDTTISDIPTSQEPSGWGGYGLNNNGEHLLLLDGNSMIIDEVNCSGGWFAGETSPNYKTMERKDTRGSGSDLYNWATNNGAIINGHDAKGNPVYGTPKTENSIMNEPTPTPTSAPTPTPTPLPTPTSKPSPSATPKPSPSPTPTPTPKPTITPIPTPIITISPSPISKPEIKESKTIYPAGIIINEILPSPEGLDETDEWIEIFNENSLEVNLTGWQISDTVGKTTVYTLPKGKKISPQGFLVLKRPETKITLNNDGDGLKFIQPDGNVIDSVNYEKAPKGQSYNRIDSKWVWSKTLTPGSENIIPKPISEKKEVKSLKEAQEITPEKGLAAVGEEIPNSSNLYIFLIALAIGIFSGIIILILKKKIKTS